MLDFSFAALTVNILVGQQEGHPACMKLGVGGDDMTGAFTYYSSSCHHHIHHSQL